MTNPAVATNTGTRFAFAPYPIATEELLFRIYVVFETSRGDLLCAHTNLMAPTIETEDTICDTLNVHVDLNRDQWKCLASAAFDAVETAKEQAASEAKTAASGRTVAPYDPDEPW